MKRRAAALFLAFVIDGAPEVSPGLVSVQD